MSTFAFVSGDCLAGSFLFRVSTWCWPTGSDINSPFRTLAVLLWSDILLALLGLPFNPCWCCPQGWTAFFWVALCCWGRSSGAAGARFLMQLGEGWPCRWAGLGRGTWVSSFPGLWLKREVRNVFRPCLLVVLSCSLLWPLSPRPMADKGSLGSHTAFPQVSSQPPSFFPGFRVLLSFSVDNFQGYLVAVRGHSREK